MLGHRIELREGTLRINLSDIFNCVFCFKCDEKASAKLLLTMFFLWCTRY